ncbi:hypothetical protein ABTW72_12515 [Micromonospora sp. NPDC127501]|uniref:hypothetical protein n=1 Tax=Micromonospora sp. NPDC127501 TaxID=3154872 RepID=UPI003324F6D9
MTRTILRRLVAGVLGAGVALTGLSGPAIAASGDTAVSVGRLVLEPTDRGYAGSLQVTVNYRGHEASYLKLAVSEAVPGAFDGLDPADPCVYGVAEPARTIHCHVPGGALQPGERRKFTVDFRVLTTTRPYAMVTSGGKVAITTGDRNPANDTAAFSALFRSTTGSLRAPRPYVRDTNTNSVVNAGPSVLTRQEDGSWLGRVPMTVRVAGDAAHDAYWLTPTLPSGVEIGGTEPADVCTASCMVAGGTFMPGEERKIDLLIWAPAEVAPGDLGTGSVHLGASFGWGGLLTDVDPADNVATFAITAG